MADPQVPIDVDPDTGVWRTDGLPMLYVPRHFFMSNHAMIESALGEEAYARCLYQAGYKAAYAWCAHEAAVQGLTGMAVFHHYMTRLSQRGWGLFDGTGIDGATGHGRIVLRHSCFVLHFGSNAGRKLCYMCAGWPSGALDWVAASAGKAERVRAREILCAGEGQKHCEFSVELVPNAG
jgi:predicted hydrocarbon binding protein